MTKPEMHIDKKKAKRWYLNGLLHREDGPAVEYANGTKLWYLNGKRHREDGPAVIFSFEKEKIEWWLNGEFIDVTKPENWDELVKLAQVRRIMDD